MAEERHSESYAVEHHQHNNNWIGGFLKWGAPSTVEGELRSFLCHRRTHLKLPPSTMSPSAAFVSIDVVVAIRNFLHLPTVIQSFLYRCYYHP
ncbi:hypothetical protein BHE74_00023653 [Ensete ventricosum]|uniref:Uncharacterized protein n=1 Tax=Ensete ventricosum TaxID=4639 RepID=A0A445ME10_ENSVE|nr:hypothetical protein BHE74_00023653 [Ensete ventricosum]RZR72512.1 hypothetical protein BHM03_00014183 [Ensete ventricosum]